MKNDKLLRVQLCFTVALLTGAVMSVEGAARDPLEKEVISVLVPGYDFASDRDPKTKTRVNLGAIALLSTDTARYGRLVAARHDDAIIVLERLNGKLQVIARGKMPVVKGSNEVDFQGARYCIAGPSEYAFSPRDFGLWIRCVESTTGIGYDREYEARADILYRIHRGGLHEVFRATSRDESHMEYKKKEQIEFVAGIRQAAFADLIVLRSPGAVESTWTNPETQEQENGDESEVPRTPSQRYAWVERYVWRGLENRYVLKDKKPFSAAASRLSATASSQLAGPKAQPDRYAASRAIDGRLDTAWCEGNEGHGEDDFLELTLDFAAPLREIVVTPGLFRTPELWAANHRPRTLEIETDKGCKHTLTLSDKRGPQTIRLDCGEVEITTVTLVIRDVFKGGSHEDTCISEVELR